MPRAPVVKKSSEQVAALEECFYEHVGVLSKEVRAGLAERTQLSEKQVTSWFASTKKAVRNLPLAVKAGSGDDQDPDRIDGNDMMECDADLSGAGEAAGAANAARQGAALTKASIARFFSHKQASEGEWAAKAEAAKATKIVRAAQRAADKAQKEQEAADAKALAVDWPSAVWVDVRDTLQALLRVRGGDHAAVLDDAIAHLQALYLCRKQPVPATVTRLRVAHALKALVAHNKAWELPARHHHAHLLRPAPLSHDVAVSHGLPADATLLMNRQLHDLFDVKKKFNCTLGHSSRLHGTNNETMRKRPSATHRRAFAAARHGRLRQRKWLPPSYKAVGIIDAIPWTSVHYSLLCLQLRSAPERKCTGAHQ